MVKLVYRNKNSAEVMELQITSDIAHDMIAQHIHEWDMFYCQGTFTPTPGVAKK